MSNSLGIFYIYFLGLGWLLFGLSMQVASVFAIWQMIIPHGLMIWSWAVPLTVVIFGILTFFFLSFLKPILRDIRTGLVSMVGGVRAKWIFEEFTPYGRIIDYHIKIEEIDFEVSEKIYRWLELGEEVLINYWPSTRRVCRVDRLCLNKKRGVI